jgi:hypothetical protein
MFKQLILVRDTVREHQGKEAPCVVEHTFELNCMPWTVEVHFDYTPAEPMAFDYPGCLAEVEILSVKASGVDIQDALPRTILDELRHALGHGKTAEEVAREARAAKGANDEG